jgi:hypothetical protein
VKGLSNFPTLAIAAPAYNVATVSSFFFSTILQQLHLKALFDLMDTNNNDFVSKMEFLEFIRENKPKHGPFSSTAKLQTVFGLTKASQVNREDFQRVFATYEVVGLEASMFDVSLGDEEDEGVEEFAGGFTAEEMQEMRDSDYKLALEAAQEVVQGAMVEYRTAYSRHLNGAGNIARRDKFGAVAGKIFAKCKGNIDGLKVVLLQPSFEVPKEKKAQFMLVCRREFRQAMSKTDKALMVIATKANAIFKTGPIKTEERWIEKARISYGNELRRMTDIERRSFVCENFDDLTEVLQLIDQEFHTIRIKNRFEAANSAAKDTAAYRDCQVLCYALGTKLMFEIQLHLECIHQLKDEIALKVGPDGRTGHQKYIEFRELKEVADAEHRKR